MRSLTALALYVCLAAATSAAGAEKNKEQEWLSLYDQGLKAIQNHDFAGAAEFFRKSEDVAPDPLARGVSANDLGVTLHELYRDPEARVQLETALQIWKTHPGQEGRLAVTAQGLASTCRAIGDYPAAEKVLREAMKRLPPDTDNQALVLNELGDILREMGHTVEAHELLERVLGFEGVSMRRRLDATLGLADLDRGDESWESSLELFRQGEQQAHKQGWTGLEAVAVRGQGMTWLEMGKTARAEPLLRRALAILETGPSDPQQVSSTMSCLAQLYLLDDKPGLADETLTKALELSAKALGDNHPQTAMLLEMKSEATSLLGRYEDAREYSQKAYRIMTSWFGEQSPVTASVLASWAVIEQRAKHYAQAEDAYLKALAIYTASGPEARGVQLVAERNYAQLCKAMHKKVPPSSQSFLAKAEKRRSQ